MRRGWPRFMKVKLVFSLLGQPSGFIWRLFAFGLPKPTLASAAKPAGDCAGSTCC